MGFGIDGVAAVNVHVAVWRDLPRNGRLTNLPDGAERISSHDHETIEPPFDGFDRRLMQCCPFSALLTASRIGLGSDLNDIRCQRDCAYTDASCQKYSQNEQRNSHQL